MNCGAMGPPSLGRGRGKGRLVNPAMGGLADTTNLPTGLNSTREFVIFLNLCLVYLGRFRKLFFIIQYLRLMWTK